MANKTTRLKKVQIPELDTLYNFDDLGGRPKYGGVEMTSETDIPSFDRIKDELHSAIIAEATARDDADDELQRQIDENKTSAEEAIEAEAKAREEADTELKKEVQEEIVPKIEAETTARVDADNNLQEQIDTIVNSSDVKDVVDTYADLQSYDKTTLGDNDIIKVLTDETSEGATTYYRFIKSKNDFDKVGSIGPYYTKAEIDKQIGPKLITSLDNLLVGSSGASMNYKYRNPANGVEYSTGLGTIGWAGSNEFGGLVKRADYNEFKELVRKADAGEIGGAHLLTAADNNWNYAAKDAVEPYDTIALFLLKPGLYYLPKDNPEHLWIAQSARGDWDNFLPPYEDTTTRSFLVTSRARNGFLVMFAYGSGSYGNYVEKRITVDKNNTTIQSGSGEILSSYNIVTDVNNTNNATVPSTTITKDLNKRLTALEEGGGGGIEEITTDDSRFSTNLQILGNNLEAGIYKLTNVSSDNIWFTDTTLQNSSLGIMPGKSAICIVSDSYVKQLMITGLYASHTGNVLSGWVIKNVGSAGVRLVGSIYDSLEKPTSSVTNMQALGARQGYILDSKIGIDLNNLTTNDKSNLIAAINEVNGKSGGGGDGIKALTEADYNYDYGSTGQNNCIAAWLLPAGLYSMEPSKSGDQGSELQVIIDKYGSYDTRYIKGATVMLVLEYQGGVRNVYLFTNSQTSGSDGTNGPLRVYEITQEGNYFDNSYYSFLYTKNILKNFDDVNYSQDVLSAELGKDLNNRVKELEEGGGSGVEVVQETGTSETAVMSQNAATRMVFNTGNRVSIGRDSTAWNSNSIVIGNNSTANQDSVTLGEAAISQAGGVSIGYKASDNSSIMNRNQGNVVIGNQAKADKTGSIALGCGSHATQVGQFDVSAVGNYGYNGSNYRLLTGLYDPQDDHDAATKGYVDLAVAGLSIDAYTKAEIDGKLGQKFVRADSTTVTTNGIDTVSIALGYYNPADETSGTDSKQFPIASRSGVGVLARADYIKFDDAATTATEAKSTADTALETANSAASSASSASSQAIAAQSMASTASQKANEAQTAAEEAKALTANPLTVVSRFGVQDSCTFTAQELVKRGSNDFTLCPAYSSQIWFTNIPKGSYLVRARIKSFNLELNRAIGLGMGFNLGAQGETLSQTGAFIHRFPYAQTLNLEGEWIEAVMTVPQDVKNSYIYPCLIHMDTPVVSIENQTTCIFDTVMLVKVAD